MSQKLTGTAVLYRSTLYMYCRPTCLQQGSNYKKKVEGGELGIEIGYFSMPILLLRGGSTKGITKVELQ